jgi:NAD(P)-dependent dehydrogenase (short-subunit alcohol dehydrogenase family)
VVTSVVVGGSGGLGLFIAGRMAARGESVVITSRDAGKAAVVAGQLGAGAVGIALDLTRPEEIADRLASISEVDNLVITAFSAYANTLQDFNIPEAVAAVTTKMVGYPEVVRVLLPRMGPAASVVLFGGVAKDRPYPGSTIVTTHNGGVSALVRTLAVEIAPHRVNAIHPVVVGDSPRWSHLPEHPAIARTPIGRLVTMEEIADATEFLLRNQGVNGQDLTVEGGTLAT